MKQKIILCWFVFMAISTFTHVSGYFRKQKPYKKLLVVHSTNFNGIIEAKNMGAKSYTLHTIDKKTGKETAVFIKYDVYAMQSGDINNDGKMDICIGVITPKIMYKNAEESIQKTLFVLEIDDGNIRPLMPQALFDKPLENFKIFCRNEKSIIRTIEKEKNNTFSVGEYEWNHAKLKLLSYKGTNLDMEKAKFIMYQIR